MDAANASVPSSISVPAVIFTRNEDFHKRDLTHDDDIKFRRQEKPGAKSKRSDRPIDRETLKTLLAMQETENSSQDCVDKLLKEDIAYAELSALTKEDLELMGIKHCEQQQELLKFFSMLPNQYPSYDTICNYPKAGTYNSQILDGATRHMMALQSALVASNYKLKLMPPNDVIVGDKNFASSFVLDAIKELSGVTNEIEHTLEDIEQLIADGQKKSLPKSSSYISMGKYILITSLGVATLAALWLWKSKKIMWF